MIIEPSEIFSLAKNLTDVDQSEEEMFLQVIVICIIYNIYYLTAS